ncbi:hypothetical protein KX935_05185 [Streptobacillus moniliformis]|uniref:hypothetical protein n=2 Tax=Streptobacillus moniliformis TaxID=34105 RepID=UPI0007E41B01|nr:hypothetical protein [Streptobacillus moniliformis]QXW65220.1 hypothetical protein KX935_05185 [Streptobacillus moniliformis]
MKKIFIGLIFILIGIFLLNRSKYSYINDDRLNSDNKYVIEKTFDSINNIDIKNFIGKIIIEKADENSIFIESDREINYLYDNGKLSLEIIEGKIKSLKVRIRYKEKEKLDVNLENFFGDIKLNAPSKGKIDLYNIFGKIEINTEKDANVITRNIVGRIFLSSINDNSELNIIIENAVGKVSVKNRL